jgi:predicted RNase H-like HicB family nuclease
MSFPVIIHQDNGQFVATLLGAPNMRAIGPTREDVLAKMQDALQQRVSVGELVFLDVLPEEEGIMASAGKYRDDPTLSDIRAEIYRERDAEPKE